jgi:hypothetical protein
MSAQAVIVHALKQGTPLVMEIAPHVWPTGVAPVRVNLTKIDPEYRHCFLCGGEPLYRVTWATPGAWWGNTHSEDYCHGCVMGRGVTAGWVRPAPTTPGVSLAKPSDSGLDRALSIGPIGLGPSLDTNNLRALALTFRVLARLGG